MYNVARRKDTFHVSSCEYIEAYIKEMYFFKYTVYSCCVAMYIVTINQNSDKFSFPNLPKLLYFLRHLIETCRK